MALCKIAVTSLLMHWSYCRLARSHRYRHITRQHTKRNKLRQINLTPLTSPAVVEVIFHIVTVQLGATEDDSFVHLVFPDGTHTVLALQHLHGFWHHLWKERERKNEIRCNVRPSCVPGWHAHITRTLASSWHLTSSLWKNKGYDQHMIKEWTEWPTYYRQHFRIHSLESVFILIKFHVGSVTHVSYWHIHEIPWASCQIRKIAGAHALGMPGTFSPSPQVSDPDMHHGTCVTHVPWCMPGSLTSSFLWNRRRGKTFPAFPAHAQPAILRIW